MNKLSSTERDGCDSGKQAPDRGLSASALLRGLATHFNDADYVEATARALSAAGDDRRAERVYRHARKLRPACGHMVREHATLLLRLGRTDEAISVLEAAATEEALAEGERGLIECLMAECLRDRGEYQRARHIVERWLVHEKTWDLATFIWVDCVTLSAASLEQELKLAVEAGRASPAMIHAFLQELPVDAHPHVARAILNAADHTLFPGWLSTIPDLHRLAIRLLSAGSTYRVAH